MAPRGRERRGSNSGDEQAAPGESHALSALHPDARIAGDKNHLPPTLEGSLEVGPQDPELVDSTDQRRGHLTPGITTDNNQPYGPAHISLQVDYAVIEVTIEHEPDEATVAHIGQTEPGFESALRWSDTARHIIL